MERGANIVILKFVHILGWSDDVVSCAITPHNFPLSIQRTFNQGLCTLMTLIRELNRLDRPRRRGWIDEYVGVSSREAIPFEIWREFLAGSYSSKRLSQSKPSRHKDFVTYQ